MRKRTRGTLPSEPAGWRERRVTGDKARGGGEGVAKRAGETASVCEG